MPQPLRHAVKGGYSLSQKRISPFKSPKRKVLDWQSQSRITFLPPEWKCLRAALPRIELLHDLPLLLLSAVAQPLAALPPYGCGVPFTGSDRHWHSQISGRLADRTGFQIWKPCAIKSIPQKMPACMALIEFRCRPIVQFSRFTP